MLYLVQGVAKVHDLVGGECVPHVTSTDLGVPVEHSTSDPACPGAVQQVPPPPVALQLCQLYGKVHHLSQALHYFPLNARYATCKTNKYGK